MRILTTLLLAGMVVALGLIGVAYSGLYNVAATEPHSGFVRWFLSTASYASIDRRATGIVVPELTNDSLVLAGVGDFSAMCVGCHGAPGVAPDPMGQGLNPPAPDLAESAAQMTPAALFWVTKNGIKMTGMPAWGATHDDNALWPVVALMTRLPEMDADSYQQLVVSAEGKGHHAAADQTETEHDHSAHEHEDAASAVEEVPNDDGHDHKH